MLLQTILNGLIVGGVYALVALGLTLIFGILHIPNFSHGPVFMVGAFLSYFLIIKFGLSYFEALIVSMILTALLNMIIEKVFFRPLRLSQGHFLLIAALGVYIILENITLILVGPDPRPLPSPLIDRVIDLGVISVTYQRITSLLVAVGFIILLQVFIKKTRSGKAMRAMAQDREAAYLMGIKIDRVASLTFAIGGALAAVAGTLLGPIFFVYPSMGYFPVLKAFVIIVLGGLGSIPGAIYGGLILGLSENLGAGYISAAYRDGFAFAVLIGVLLIRPSGLFGERVKT